VNAEKKGLFRFAVLIPHRDFVKPLEAWRSALFAAGVDGAWSFPVCVPLASLSRPLNREALKELASSLRALSVKDGRGGWFRTMGTAEIDVPGGFRLFGLRLGFSPAPAAGPEQYSFLGPELSALGILKGMNAFRPLPEALIPGNFFSLQGSHTPSACGAADCPGPEPAGGGLRETRTLPELQPIAFRAAMAANLALRFLDSGEKGYSFEWRIGEPVWLPKPARPAKQTER
jgi:hypothetical protein